MDVSLLKKSYFNSYNRISKAVEGLTPEEATFRPYDKANSMVWQVGHLMFFRNTVIKLLNPTEVLEVTPNEKELFGNGSHPADASAYPTIETVLDIMEKRGQRIGELLPTVSAEHLAAESPFKIPNLGVTVGQQVFSFMIHEANHYGEINYLKTIINRLREQAEA